MEGFVQDPTFLHVVYYGLAFEGTGSFLQTDVWIPIRAYDQNRAKAWTKIPVNFKGDVYKIEVYPRYYLY